MEMKKHVRKPRWSILACLWRVCFWNVLAVPGFFCNALMIGIENLSTKLPSYLSNYTHYPINVCIHFCDWGMYVCFVCVRVVWKDGKRSVKISHTCDVTIVNLFEKNVSNGTFVYYFSFPSFKVWISKTHFLINQ